MAYSNQTANYGLPQYVGSDLATWQDNTEAWAKVDAGMQANKTAAASASTAAGQAQAAANAAQSQAGAVNSKVTNLVNDLTFTAKTCTKTANIANTTGIKCVSSNSMGVFSSSFRLVQKSSLSTFTSGDDITGIAVYTCPNNLFNLDVSTGSDQTKQFYVGGMQAYIQKSGGTLSYFSAQMLAYWDGSKTNFFIPVANTTLSGLDDTDQIITGGSLTWFLTGVIIPTTV